MKNLAITVPLSIAVFGTLVLFLVSTGLQQKIVEPLGGTVAYDLTNGTSTVNTTSTALPVYSQYLRVTNLSTEDVSCFAETETAASSTVRDTAGIVIGKSGSTTSTVPSVEEFGYCYNCIPYIGPLNCTAPSAVEVATAYR